MAFCQWLIFPKKCCWIVVEWLKIKSVKKQGSVVDIILSTSMEDPVDVTLTLADGKQSTIATNLCKIKGLLQKSHCKSITKKSSKDTFLLSLVSCDLVIYWWSFVKKYSTEINLSDIDSRLHHAYASTYVLSIYIYKPLRCDKFSTWRTRGGAGGSFPFDLMIQMCFEKK